MQPLVSICMITYNHEKYIAQAIESVLMQETNFAYELVIGEDCSTDNTRNIIEEYGDRYPDRIRLLLHEKNLGVHKNLICNLQACKGKYIAYLEGDDYWISYDKLQKQVNFLENHPECSISYHKCKFAQEDQPPTKDLILEVNPQPISKLEKLLGGNFLPTCSVMVRNDLISRFPDWIYNYWFLDWTLNILNAQLGDIGFIDEFMGVYRNHSMGLSKTVDSVKFHLEIIDFLEFLDGYFDNQYTDVISATISENCFAVSVIYLSKNNITAAKRYFLQGIYKNPMKSKTSKIEIIKLFLKLFLFRVGH